MCQGVPKYWRHFYSKISVSQIIIPTIYEGKFKSFFFHELYRHKQLDKCCLFWFRNLDDLLFYQKQGQVIWNKQDKSLTPNLPLLINQPDLIDNPITCDLHAKISLDFLSSLNTSFWGISFVLAFSEIQHNSKERTWYIYIDCKLQLPNTEEGTDTVS